MDQEKPNEQQRTPTPRWKKVLMIVAGLLVLAGAGLKVTAWASRDKNPPAARSGEPAPKGAQGFAAGGPTSSDRPSAESSPEKPGFGEKASPFLLSGGISFFVGLAVGTVLRMFFKIALLIAGIGVLGLVGLSYAGVIGPIDWKGIESWMSSRVEDVQKQTAGFQDYLLVSLPSAGMAGAGVVSGFKKK